MNLSELKLGSLVEQISSVIKSREVPLPVEGVNVEGLPFRDGYFVVKFERAFLFFVATF